MGDSGDLSELGLLGGFAFSVGGEALLGITGGSRRLLAFLALRDRPATRDQVAGSLWPDSTDEHANASLRSAMSRLNISAPSAMKATHGDLALEAGVVVDVRFSQSLARRVIDPTAVEADRDIGRLAVAALSDDILPGWYDDWVVLAAEDWHQLRLHALEAVAARLTDADRLGEAASAALNAVHAEPLRESSRAALIRVHLADGNQAAAQGEFERYRILLNAELGLEPTKRLTELLTSLRPS